MTRQINKILIFSIIFISAIDISNSVLAFSEIISSNNSGAGISRDVNELSLTDCLEYFIKNGYLQDYTFRRLFSVNKYNSTRPENNKLYIGMQLNNSFNLKIDKSEKKARFVIYDYENKSLIDLGFSEPGFYLSNNSDMIVYQTAPDKKPKVIILRRNENSTIEKYEIENALFPVLNNKRKLCYCLITGFTKDNLPKTKLVFRDLDSGKETIRENPVLSIMGSSEINITQDIGCLMPDFSPLYSYCYVSYTGIKDNLRLRIVPGDILAAHDMKHEDIGPMSMFPYYYSDIMGGKFIFQSRKIFSGNNWGTTEYSIAQSPEITSYTNFENFQSQMTSNNIAEWHARIYDQGYFYIEYPGGNLFYKNRKFSNIKPLYFEVWDNLFVYAAQREDSKGADIKIIRILDSSSNSREIDFNISDSIQRLLGSD